MEINENTEPSHITNSEETNPQINVILSGNQSYLSMLAAMPQNVSLTWVLATHV